MLTTTQEIATQDRALYLAGLLRGVATIGLHLEAASMIENLHKQLQTVRDEAYAEGRTHALYEVRNSINEKFGL